MKTIDQIEAKISSDNHINRDELRKESLIAFLQYKIKKLKVEKLEILKKYHVNNINDFENKIKSGDIPEHPAWEDFIHLENIGNSIISLTNDLEAI